MIKRISAKIKKRSLHKRVILALLLVLFAGIGSYFILNSSASSSVPTLANVFVSPNGSDAGSNCKLFTTAVGNPDTSTGATLCKSFEKAVSLVQAGGTVLVKSGTYGDQTITSDKGSTTYVVAEDGTTIGGFKPDSSWVEYQNFTAANLDMENISPTNVTSRNVNIAAQGHVTFDGPDNFTWIGGTVGPYQIDDGDWPGRFQIQGIPDTTNNLVLDGLIVQPVTRTQACINDSTNCHTEVVRFNEGVTSAILRNMTFQNGSGINSATIFTGSTSSGSVANLTLENNFFGSNGGQPIVDENPSGACGNWTFRNNTMATTGAAFVENDCSSATNVKIIGNIGQVPICRTGVTYSNNVWFNGTCGSTDINAGSGLSSLGLGGSDGFHLTATSPAKDHGDPTSFPALDHDGGARPFGSAPDAGAHEYGSSPPSSGGNGISANVFVATNGNDSGTNCRRISPATTTSPDTTGATLCKTFGAAWNKASAGDTIYVKAGTYPAQIVSGDKTAETRIVGENGTKVAGDAICKDGYGSDGAFCANAQNMTLENMTLDAGTNAGVSSGSQINATNVKYKNVNLYGDFVNITINSSNFTWQGGSHGQDGIDGGKRRCDQPLGEPVWVWASNVTIDGVRFNPKKIQAGVAGSSCGSDNTPHIEIIRLESGASNFTVKNSWFVAGSDAGSGHIFTSTAAPGLKLINNYFEPVNGTYTIQAGSSACDWTFLYNTFTQGSNLGCTSSSTWVGNLGVSQGCSGSVHMKNVWQGTNNGTACNGADKTFSNLGILSGGHLASTSPAIDAAETDTASDYCTGNLVGSTDYDGNVRPQGAACDAGADEFASGGTTSPKPGDVNNDGLVNIIDLSTLLSKWNTNYPQADFNGDNIVNIFDLSILLSNYGK